MQSGKVSDARGSLRRFGYLEEERYQTRGGDGAEKEDGLISQPCRAEMRLDSLGMPGRRLATGWQRIRGSDNLKSADWSVALSQPVPGLAAST